MIRLLTLSKADAVGSGSVPAANGYDYDYYVGPGGNDGSSGTSYANRWKTWGKVWDERATLTGKTIMATNGTHSVAAQTGVPHFTGTNCGQIPAGISKAVPTQVVAETRGSVIFDGAGAGVSESTGRALFIGRSTRVDDYITVDGIKCLGGAHVYRTSYIYLKNCGFRKTTSGQGNVLGIGTNDGGYAYHNDHVLVEDCWVWGKERLQLLVFHSDSVILRRVVVRRDGCDALSPGNPVVGTTFYYATNCRQQNVICVDGILGEQSDDPYADFAQAFHGESEPHGSNKWQGVISAKSPDDGMYLECDQAAYGSYMAQVEHSAIILPTSVGMNHGGGQATNQVFHNFNNTVVVNNAAKDAFRGHPGAVHSSSIVRNNIGVGRPNGRYGWNHQVAPSYMDIYGSWAESAYNQSSCSSNCRTTNPEADGTPASLKYPFRIEAGSALSGAGYGGADYGARIVKRWGTTGAFYGDSGYDDLTDEELWPYPNEALIRTQRRADSERGFCADGQNLTDYLWNLLGNGGYPD